MEKYKSLEEIGSGTYGEVCLAMETDTKHFFAIKKIRLGKMPSEDNRKGVRKEVTALSRLKHRNIVSYRESFEDQKYLYIVMGFCFRGDLFDKIEEKIESKTSFTIEEVMNMAHQLCQAVGYIHGQHVMHRDIKPRNIFFVDEMILKLGDFGCVKILDSSSQLASTHIGTLAYSAPEIFSEMPYTKQCDIWSFGCVLYELVTLKKAFPANNFGTLVEKIKGVDYPPLPSSTIYSGVRDLIGQLLVKDAGNRPSARKLLEVFFKDGFAVSSSQSETAAEDGHPQHNIETAAEGRRRHNPEIIFRSPSATKSTISKTNNERNHLPTRELLEEFFKDVLAGSSSQSETAAEDGHPQHNIETAAEGRRRHNPEIIFRSPSATKSTISKTNNERNSRSAVELLEGFFKDGLAGSSIQSETAAEDGHPQHNIETAAEDGHPQHNIETAADNGHPQHNIETATEVRRRHNPEIIFRSPSATKSTISKTNNERNSLPTRELLEEFLKDGLAVSSSQSETAAEDGHPQHNIETAAEGIRRHDPEIFSRSPSATKSTISKTNNERYLQRSILTSASNLFRATPDQFSGRNIIATDASLCLKMLMPHLVLQQSQQSSYEEFDGVNDCEVLAEKKWKRSWNKLRKTYNDLT